MADSNCIFCRIVQREIPSNIVREDEHTVAFRDLDPKAPTHVLVVPRAHVASVNDVDAAHADALGALFLAAREVAQSEGIAGAGYRLVVNTGAAAGQTVHHLHMHVLGGRDMRWPPG
jgi:histidine triad (HIT) family protein